MRVTRIVMLVAIPALFAAALVLERDPVPATAPSGAMLERFAPVMSTGDAGSSTWFCAAGSARGPDGPAEQIVIIANDGEEAVEATLTAHSDTGEQATRTVDLAARSREQVRVSDVLPAEWAGVVVEAPDAAIAVDHVVTGPTGRSSGPCTSSVSDRWYLPAGTTVLGAAHHLVLFNPFAADAVVDVTFETETDRRTPPEYQGLVIPAGQVSVLAVSDVVTVREQLATEVTTRTGLIVAEQVELVGEDSDLPTSTALTLGAPRSAGTWHLPAGRALEDGVRTRVVVHNPADEQAEVDVQVVLEDPEAHPFVEPFELSVRPGQYAEVDLGEDGRVPTGVRWSAFATTRNDVDVVAALVVDAGGEVSPRGRSVTLGSPVTSHAWHVPYGGVADGGASGLAVLNPSSSEERRVRVEAVTGGAVEDVPGLTEVVLPPGGRASLRPEELGDPGAASLRVTADGPIAVARTQDFGEQGFATSPAIAEASTLAAATPPEVDPTTDPSVALEGIVPDDTAGPPPDDTSGAGPPDGEDPASGDDGTGEGGDGTDDAPADGAPPEGEPGDDAPAGGDAPADGTPADEPSGDGGSAAEEEARVDDGADAPGAGGGT